jgi:hypothetical protein
MLQRRSPASAAIVILLGLAVSDDAVACACCTDQGYRNVNVVALDENRLEEIARLRFVEPARLFVGPGGLEAIEGIENPAERYPLKVVPMVGGLFFGFGGGRSVGLVFPDKLSVFEVDPRVAPDQGASPVLYKEWKLTGKTSGTGEFSAANDPNQRATLVLHGRGNACTTASDFTHWTLVMEGPKANYLIFGGLKPPY